MISFGNPRFFKFLASYIPPDDEFMFHPLSLSLSLSLSLYLWNFHWHLDIDDPQHGGLQFVFFCKKFIFTFIGISCLKITNLYLSNLYYE